MHGVQCTLPPDESGRVLDRLAGLEEVSHPKRSSKHFQATGRVDPRRCTLSHGVILSVVLAMGIFTELSIRQASSTPVDFASANQRRIAPVSVSARERLGVAPVRYLFEQTVRPLAQPTTPGAFYQGLRLMGIDGTVYDVPDSEADAAAFSRPSAGPRGEGHSRGSHNHWNRNVR